MADEEIVGNAVPTLPLRGLLSKYGPAPSAEAIDENRAEILGNFVSRPIHVWGRTRPRSLVVASGDHIGISSISLAEIVYLIAQSYAAGGAGPPRGG